MPRYSALAKRSILLGVVPVLATTALAFTGASLAQQELDGAEPPVQAVADPAPAQAASQEMADEATSVADAAMDDDEPEALVDPDGLTDVAEDMDAAPNPAPEVATDTATVNAPITDESLPVPAEYYQPGDAAPEPLTGDAVVTFDEGKEALIAEAEAAAGVYAAPKTTSSPALSTVGLSVRQPINVTVDRAKVLRLSEPAETVIIGNPAIVDVTLQDSRTMVLTAKGYGTTNLIVLNAEGLPLADEVVQTQRASATIARVYRGTQQYSYSCTPECTRTIAVGDVNDYFESAKTQAEGRAAWASGGGN